MRSTESPTSSRARCCWLLAGASEGQHGRAAGLFNAPASQVARLAAALQEKKSGEAAA